MSDIDLAIATINALAQCPCCEGKGKFIPECPACMSGLGKCTCAEETCPNCDGSGEIYGDPKGKELLAEWRKKYPKI